LNILAFGALWLSAHILIAGNFKTKQYGKHWDLGARDEYLMPLNAVAGRLVRAQANYQETFPIAVVALMGVVMADRANATTELGGSI